MAQIRRNEWEDILHETALNAAGAWRKWVEGPGQTKSSDEAEKRTYETIFERLMKEYPYEEATLDTMRSLYDYKPETVWRWVINGTTDPRKEMEALEASKFLPYLTGVAKEGEDWTSTPPKALQEKATNELKYPYTKEGFSQFLKDVATQQERFDRAKVLDEWRDSWQYYPFMAGYPSVNEYLENIIAEGRDVDPTKLTQLGFTDLGANYVMVGSPGLSLMKSPVSNNILNAAIQGVAESGRQGAKGLVDEDLKFDWTAPVAATTLGATRPGMVSTAQGIASRFPGPTAQNFSRGVMKALKAGDPMDIEERKIANMVNLFNDIVKKSKGTKYYVTPPLSEANKMRGAGKIRDIARALDVEPEKDGTYSLEKILESYGRRIKPTLEVSDGTVTQVSPTMGNSGNGQLSLFPDMKVSGNVKEFLVTPEQEKLIQSYLPAKYSFEDAESKARTAGLIIGKLLGDIGTRVEPTIKANPLNVGRDFVRPYQKQAWYRRLTEDQRKVVDEAFKKSEEEE